MIEITLWHMGLYEVKKVSEADDLRKAGVVVPFRE